MSVGHYKYINHMLHFAMHLSTKIKINVKKGYYYKFTLNPLLQTSTIVMSDQYAKYCRRYSIIELLEIKQ